MSDGESSFGDKLARACRFVLVAGIAVAVALVVSGSTGAPLNPFSLSRANAQGGITTAPGYIALSTVTDQTDRFYIIDTNRQVICVYNMTNGQLRLVAARKFDFDTQIWDASNLGGSLPGFEAGNPIPRNPPVNQPNAMCAQNYAKAFQSFWETKGKVK